MNDLRVLARGAGNGSHAIVCGACTSAIAEASRGVLTFSLDGDDQWKGWVGSVRWQPELPGGLWEVVPKHGTKQPPLDFQLEVLPAIIECPACAAGNLFDPEKLVLRPNQLVARAHLLRLA